MYKGEVNVGESCLPAFLKTAKSLQVVQKLLHWKIFNEFQWKLFGFFIGSRLNR